MAKRTSKSTARPEPPPPDQRAVSTLSDAVFQPEFLEDLRHWVDVDRKVALRVLSLIEAVISDPYDGIGKPELLKYLDPDTWSRRITQEHRLVYRVSKNRIDFLQARYHYE